MPNLSANWDNSATQCEICQDAVIANTFIGIGSAPYPSGLSGFTWKTTAKKQTMDLFLAVGIHITLPGIYITNK